MDFIDQLCLLATRIDSTKTMILTEETTKNAMVMPFIQILGYNPFERLEQFFSEKFKAQRIIQRIQLPNQGNNLVTKSRGSSIYA